MLLFIFFFFRFAVRETYPIERAKGHVIPTSDELASIIQKSKNGEPLKKILNPNLGQYSNLLCLFLFFLPSVFYMISYIFYNISLENKVKQCIKKFIEITKKALGDKEETKEIIRLSKNIYLEISQSTC